MGRTFFWDIILFIQWFLNLWFRWMFETEDATVSLRMLILSLSLSEFDYLTKNSTPGGYRNPDSLVTKWLTTLLNTWNTRQCSDVVLRPTGITSRTPRCHDCNDHPSKMLPTQTCPSHFCFFSVGNQTRNTYPRIYFGICFPSVCDFTGWLW
jgi:hypothetical protein